MTVYRSGQADSGLDRALDLALRAELDDVLETGELWPGERHDFPEPRAGANVHRPWQQPMSKTRQPPANDISLWQMLVARLKARLRNQRAALKALPEQGEDTAYDRTIGPVPKLGDAYYETRDDRVRAKNEAKRYLTWRPDRVGIVVVHGIGPHLAGQTLLDWTRPIIALLNDAAAGDPGLVVPAGGARDVTDPVYRSNIDFSGETFPMIQLRIPRRNDVGPDDPRGKERHWIFTEAWWAEEVRAPTLATMIGWLGEQGGVGRIVQGIQQNMVGTGALSFIGRLSLQPIISVITSFVLLIFTALLAISKVVPIGPLRDAVVLRLASSFLTDWFGGARTLLRDPAQSANVRTRLLMTIKALRAYGCRNVVIVAHSGGTMVSLMTLTDPAFPRLRVEKLITIGEALNLGWRLNDANPDMPPPTPPTGDRMAANFADLQPDLQWRDFWATHDPAPSGRPQLPRTIPDPGLPRYSAERVYNRMAIAEDHGTYWDNDEHFLIPLIREIDVPTGDRGASRFYSDEAESVVRARRKERVGLLALWRRSLMALPLLAILAAATVSVPGFVATAGGLALNVFGLIPGNEIGAKMGDSLVHTLSGLSAAWIPQPVQPSNIGAGLYELGTWALESILVLLLLQTLLPTRVDRLWGGRFGPRLVVAIVDIAIGLGVLGLLVFGYFVVLGPTDQERVRNAIPVGHLVALGAVAVVVLFLGWVGTFARKRLRQFQGGDELGGRFRRDGLISLSSFVLGLLLIGLVVATLGTVLVFIRADDPASRDTERFVIGAVVVMLGFRLLTRLGTWRWDSWDARERRALRLNPLKKPFRVWPYILGIMLALVAFGATLFVAFGGEQSSWLAVSRDGWALLLGFSILLIVVLSLGKDIVDNDIDLPAPAGGAGGDGGGGAPPIYPNPQNTPGPAAGSGS